MAMVASQTQALEAGGSSGGPPSTISSARKHKRPPVLNHLKKLKSPTSSQLKRPAKLIKQKQPAAKIFKPPMVGNKLKSPMVTRSPVVTGSPMMRLVVSPVVMGPRLPAIHNLRSSPAVHSPRSSPTVERSPCPTASPLPSFDQQTRPTNDPGSTSTQIQPRKLRSDIWKDMDPIYHAGKLLQARCQRCNESVSLSYWTSSSRTFRSRTHGSSRPSRKVFVKIGCDNCPVAEEWEKAYAVCRLLNVFKKATEVVSGSRYPTSNLYFHQIWRVKQELDSKVSSKIPIIGSMVPGMKAKFDKYWMISYLSNCIPVILDPRFKFGFVEFRMKQAFGNMANVHIAKVDEAIRKLYND